MTDAWRPFTDEEMRRIIEGEKVKGSNKDELLSGSVKKSNLRAMRGRNYKRDNQSRLGAVKISEMNGDKQSGHQRIPQIPEEDEVEEETYREHLAPLPALSEDQNNVIFFREPLLRSESLITVSRKLDEVENQRLHPVFEEEALEKFRERQKAMEESNQLTKQVLQKALSDRAKKTREEAQKLNKIEEELKRLDQMLSSDVTFIRHQIEVASYDYMEAQKRYDRAEKEYISAKLEMYDRKERKDLLTAHLCTIIEENELRKAEKLSLLMQKLEMGADISSLTLSDADLKNEGRANGGFEEANGKDVES